MSESALARAARLALDDPQREQYIREESVENYLRKQAKKRSDRCMLEKHVSPGRSGVPDDLITWGHPLCIMELIETKAPKKSAVRINQQRDHERRARYGIKVHTLYTKADVDAYFRTMDGLMSII